MGVPFSLSKSFTTTALDISELTLLLFGIVLVAGLVGEYIESWKKKIKLFEILVIIGVAGELLADGGIFHFSKQLQTISELEVAKLNENASKANERAAILEQRLADRHVTLKQSEQMSAILKTHSGARVAVTFISPAASDAQEYAMEIAEAFAEAKWTVVPFPWMTSWESPISGFAVQIRERGSGSERKALERTTKDALSVLDERIWVKHGGSDPNADLKLDVTIFVGSK
jgi:hypothetical protein